MDEILVQMVYMYCIREAPGGCQVRECTSARSFAQPDHEGGFSKPTISPPDDEDEAFMKEMAYAHNSERSQFIRNSHRR
jgi:hypothetical protein